MLHVIDSNMEEENHSKRTTNSIMVPSPMIMLEKFECPLDIKQFISKKRHEISDIIHGKDDRLLTIVGPCSIHNINEAMEYAEKLSSIAKKYESTLLIIMRVYLEKPRTTIGWKGLIHDPHLDGTNDINYGLKIARQLLLNINHLQLACACEFLQPLITPYISDLISWAAIGARTTESQIHRELVSSLNIPIGFKNGTNGCVQMAVDACVASQKEHTSLMMNHLGNVICQHTSGNKDVHVVLRGGSISGPNYSFEHIIRTEKLLEKSHIKTKIMIDCSHGNSMKNHEHQIHVINDICQQISNDNQAIIGVMIESNLISGNQKFIEKKKHLLQYGKSITDSCIGWDTTVTQLQNLSDCVLIRRKLHQT